MDTTFEVEHIEKDKDLEGYSKITLSIISQKMEIFIYVSMRDEDLSNKYLLRSMALEGYNFYLKTVKLSKIKVGDKI